MKELTRGSDSLGRYYTSPAIGELLVRTMRLQSPSTVLELGSGDGALVGAASKIWGSARYITVDIDEQAESSRLSASGGKFFRHITGDALDPQIATRLRLRPGTACAALCNPPYIRPSWEAHFAEIMEAAGLSDVMPRVGDVPADLLFIAQNLRFLKEGGKLGLILPDGIIAGEKYQLFRKKFLTEHHVQSVIELPRQIFRGTEAKAHIVVVSKGPSRSGAVNVQSLDPTGRVLPPISAPLDLAIQRLDFSYLSGEIARSCKSTRRRTTDPLEDLVESIGRGIHNSQSRQHDRHPVLHTSDIKKDCASLPTKLRLTADQVKRSGGLLAKPGDILVARVGRNLHEKIALVRRGTYVVSDCIFVIRPKKEHGVRLATFLTSAPGRTALKEIAHGVGARFITVGALSRLRVPRVRRLKA